MAYGQMGLANSLEITKNVNQPSKATLTRRQVARLIYNTLDTKIKDNQSKLITSVFDSKVIEGVTIIASHNEDSSLGTEQIYTTAGHLNLTVILTVIMSAEKAILS